MIRSLPVNSPVRRIARVGRRMMLRGGTAEAIPAPQPFYPGLPSYPDWRSTRVPVESGTDSIAVGSFVVFIECGDDARRSLSQQEARAEITVRSVNAAGAQAARVELLSSGTPLDEKLADSTEDFAVFLRAGAVLAPEAFTLVARAHRTDPRLTTIVFDSDVIGGDGPSDPRFRPKWSPEMLLGANYIDRAFAMRTSTAAAVRNVTLDDRGMWRLLLHAGLSDDTAGNVSEVLLSEPRTSDREATEEDAAMVQEALRGAGEQASCEVIDGVVRTRFELASWPRVSIVIPTRHSTENLRRLLPGLVSTRYASFDVTIMDNGRRDQESESWYIPWHDDLDLTVSWWSESPFNYSRVNNHGVAHTSGTVIVLLNDDTEIVDPNWLHDLVGMLMRPGVGTVGFQHRRADGSVQHGGVTVGPAGYADNLFSGLHPEATTLVGPVKWYRDVLAVTGACVAIRRSDFDSVAGLDEGFQLCGSDVVLGLEQIIHGRRNVVIPFDEVRHFESVTRTNDVPRGDFFASYWRYRPWLLSGDPYLSPNVSRLSAIPRFNNPEDPSPLQLALESLGRPFTSTAQKSSISDDAKALWPLATISAEQVEAVRAGHRSVRGARRVQTVNWFLPEFDLPFFGGVNTTLRIAAKLASDHGVANRFMVTGEPATEFFASAIAAAFPQLRGSEVISYSGSNESIAALPGADAAIATFWMTAYHVAKAPNTPRKFYLVQDYEPAFYPASTMFAFAEQTYKLGLYGICNTSSLARTYTQEYGGAAMYFDPAVDRSLFHPAQSPESDGIVTIFAYARDHFRNCWELVYEALREIKRRHGAGVRIVTAGAQGLPTSADFVDLGLLDYRATGRIYRSADIGLTMQISRHPSYLPLELMASGAAMVAPDSAWFTWLFHDEVNSLLTMPTFDDLVEKLDRLVTDKQLRQRLAARGEHTITESHNDWDLALDRIYYYLESPDAFVQT